MAFGSLSGSWIEGRYFSFKGMCSRRVTGSWLLAPLVLARLTIRMQNTGALGGRVTCTANKTCYSSFLPCSTGTTPICQSPSTSCSSQPVVAAILDPAASAAATDYDNPVNAATAAATAVADSDALVIPVF